MRVPTSIRTVVLTAVAAFALVGCQSDAGTPTATSTSQDASSSASPSKTPTKTPTASETPTAKANPNGRYDWCDPSEQKSFTGPAADEFGAENVMAAYCEMVDLTMETSFQDDLMRGDRASFDALQFSAVKDHMTDSTKKNWDKSVTNYLETGEGYTDVISLYYAAPYDETTDYEVANPAVLNQSFSSAKTAVDTTSGEKRLTIEFTISGQFQMTERTSGKKFTTDASKRLALSVVPANSNEGPAWLIDGYFCQFDIEDPKPA